jgi:DNA-binding IclR family transcriptional regulator
LAEDKGESEIAIHAYAAPIFEADGRLAAALSVPFLAGATRDRLSRIRDAVIAAAQALTAEMPGGGPA